MPFGSKRIFDNSVYQPPIKRWKRLAPYIAGSFWFSIAVVTVLVLTRN